MKPSRNKIIGIVTAVVAVVAVFAFVLVMPQLGTTSEASHKSSTTSTVQNNASQKATTSTTKSESTEEAKEETEVTDSDSEKENETSVEENNPTLATESGPVIETKAESTNNASSSSQSSSTQTQPSVPESNNSGTAEKKWVEPVYETVEHPAVTHDEEYIESFTCVCGQTFPTKDAWQAHRPVPCDGKHIYAEPNWVTKTVVDQAAWTETVLVKEGYWE